MPPSRIPDGADAPERLPELFAAAFNAGDTDAVDRLFEPDAILVSDPGTAESGAGRRAAVASFAGLGAPITITVRHVYVAGDIALIIGDHVISSTEVYITGTATDVARRGADGRWRYVIDNPSGIE